MTTKISTHDSSDLTDHKKLNIFEASEKEFRGYTLDEIRYKLVVNRLKIGIAKEKIVMLTSPKVQNESNALSGYMSGIGSIMRYIDIAVIAYTVFKKFTSVVRIFRPKRR